jgi:hypothetical protein
MQSCACTRPLVQIDLNSSNCIAIEQEILESNSWICAQRTISRAGLSLTASWNVICQTKELIVGEGCDTIMHC